ncbi:acyl carrier protein [Cyanobium sp. CH-040]|uniref:acyl carrier protein n=1 Tax=Cyanobium sp. CH-040 TaxID=2823708 RepID=UPI0020CCBF40|nr:acyl carrier protein [Cyanobium sp. CH-040]MCP9928328.1 acyl carrier protein [Cyanobium sp. CH-040]
MPDPAPERAQALDALVDSLLAQSVPGADIDAVIAQLRSQAETMALEELGLESLGLMEVCLHLELDHGVPLTPDDVLLMKSVRELLDAISAHQRR